MVEGERKFEELSFFFTIDNQCIMIDLGLNFLFGIEKEAIYRSCIRMSKSTTERACFLSMMQRKEIVMIRLLCGIMSNEFGINA